MSQASAIKVCKAHGIAVMVESGILLAQTLAFSDEWQPVPHGTREDLYAWLGY